MVVASILMTMGMMMLSPLIISLPFKIMLFVLVDGWVLIIGSLFVKVIAHIKPSYVYHYYFIELKKVSDRLNGGFKINKNKRRLEEMKVSLDERLSNASSKGEIDNLGHILSVIEEITLCSNCINRLDKGFAFCPYCGEEQKLNE